MTHASLYAACATIIPVLLLTGSLQAALYRRYAQQMSEPLLPGRHRRSPRYPRWLAMVMAVVSVVLALDGEIAAITALSENHDTPGNRTSATYSTLILFAVVSVAVLVEMIVELRRPAED